MLTCATGRAFGINGSFDAGRTRLAIRGAADRLPAAAVALRPLPTSGWESDKHIYYSPVFWDSSLSGQWQIIATVYDVDARSVTHYLNGQQLSVELIPEEYLVQTVSIGSASLCNWGLPERDEPRFAVRNLNGSLDEFALFKAALSAEEIRKLYDDGNP